MAGNPIDVKPGRKPRTVLTQDNKVLRAPEAWELLPPGDATLTRRVKAAADECWVVKEKVRRRMMSRGIWAPSSIIRDLRSCIRNGKRGSKIPEAAGPGQGATGKG